MNATKLMSTADLGEYLGVPVHTIYAWRATGKGPRAYRLGKHLRYRLADVDVWLESQGDPTPARGAGQVA